MEDPQSADLESNWVSNPAIRRSRVLPAAWKVWIQSAKQLSKAVPKKLKWCTNYANLRFLSQWMFPENKPTWHDMIKCQFWSFHVWGIQLNIHSLCTKWAKSASWVASGFCWLNYARLNHFVGGVLPYAYSFTFPNIPKMPWHTHGRTCRLWDSSLRQGTWSWSWGYHLGEMDDLQFMAVSTDLSWWTWDAQPWELGGILFSDKPKWF